MSNLGYWLNPKQILTHIQTIDFEADRDRASMDASLLRKRAWIVIGVSCVCLLMVNYLKYGSRLPHAIEMLETIFVIDNSELWSAFRRHPYRELFENVWWGVWHVIGFIIIPMVTIKYILKQSLSDYGWQKGSVFEHKLGYALLALPIMCFAIIASFGDEFSTFYPFYKFAYLSWADLLLWELTYVLQFVAVEFFFRGFILNGLRVQFGSLAVAVMCLPYLMLHFPKLWLESTGAILFGFFLGVLALKSRSIWGGVFVHVVIALTMDFAALFQTTGLPGSFFR